MEEQAGKLGFWRCRNRKAGRMKWPFKFSSAPDTSDGDVFGLGDQSRDVVT